MMYLWPTGASMIGMDSGFGYIANPQPFGIPAPIKEGRRWCLDNGAYSGFEPRKFIIKMRQLLPYKDTCMFVAVPDVVGNASQTMLLYQKWKHRIEKFGYPIAFVAQDGQEGHPLPKFDWLFIGGTTEWKMGEGARQCIQLAIEMNKPVHVGRVNSWRRYQYFKALGCDSCDGTSPVFHPDVARDKITEWMNRAYNLSLFGAGAEKRR